MSRGRTTPEELDDLTLARAQKGVAEARRRLVDRYQGPVFALLSRMLPGSNQRPLVEDLAQETFLRVFRHLPRFDGCGPARLSTWILTIATRLAIDHWRKPMEIVPLCDAESGASDGRFASDRAAVARMIERAMASLPADHRAAFMLRHYHDLSYEEIAEVLEVPVGTVRSRLSRARKALQLALQPLAREKKEATHG